jgi:hypothetical protein
MARRARLPFSIIEDVNLMLFTAWEHGARHVALRPEEGGLEISYLGPDGREKTERLALCYEDTVKRLRQMSTGLGRVHVEMGGQRWHFDAIVPSARCPERVFLHMRPIE